MALDPSNPRSLVGATMGARKRAAHRDLLEREAAARTADEAAGRARSAAWFVQSLRFRESLHIGERLRPCPGPCSACCSGWCCKGGKALCDAGSSPRPWSFWWTARDYAREEGGA